MVFVIRHHDDARFAAAPSRRVRIGVAGIVERVAQHAEVAQSGPVFDGVVEAHHHVASESAQGNHFPLIVADGGQHFAVHVFLRVARFVFGHGVGELAHGGHVVEHLGDVGRAGFGSIVDSVVLAAGGRDAARKGNGAGEEHPCLLVLEVSLVHLCYVCFIV